MALTGQGRHDGRTFSWKVTFNGIVYVDSEEEINVGWPANEVVSDWTGYRVEFFEQDDATRAMYHVTDEYGQYVHFIPEAG